MDTLARKESKKKRDEYHDRAALTIGDGYTTVEELTALVAHYIKQNSEEGLRNALICLLSHYIKSIARDVFQKKASTEDCKWPFSVDENDGIRFHLERTLAFWSKFDVTTGKWIPSPPKDKATDSSVKTRIFAYGKQTTEAVKKLAKDSKETYFIYVDGYLTSQTCNKCKQRKLTNLDATGSKRKVHAVLKCNSCNNPPTRLVSHQKHL
ncbi:hypothetical protein [Parasitella parasitica]|uniref:Uncharacterized protein n=1 Tax=Parasitella parasitica TaxID=35722 RepID=A0A0B7NVL3_9FUNG|nr:hypothetical protein [Parasitella parasitica]